jgi:hypothetical protein
MSDQTSGVDYEYMTARDDKSYTQTGFYKNVVLDNTKEERELEIKAKKEKKKVILIKNI